MVALAPTKRSKLDSTRTLSEADFFSIDRERKSRPARRESVEASLWTCERKREGEKVVELKRKRLPVCPLDRPCVYYYIARTYAA
jgi:hypothetical protein